MKSSDLDSRAQTLQEHLADLRSRIINCLFILIIATAACYSISEHIFNFVRTPIAPYLSEGGLIFTGPLDKFIAHIKLAFLCGIIVSCPLWLFQVWKFVAPGLYATEKKYMMSFITAGSVLFVLGAAFSYFLVLPMAFEFLMTFGGDVDKPMISIDQYMSFFTQMCLMFGVAFEMPLIIIILGMMGVVTQDFLKRNRRYAIMLLSVIAAVITPPDIISMVMMLVPMIVLFEIGVFVVGTFEKRQAVNERE